MLPELPRHCSGETSAILNDDCLLSKYEPQLRYSKQENYHADSAAEITDNWGDESGLFGESEAGAYGNSLVGRVEADPTYTFEYELANANPRLGEGLFALSLNALGSSYPDSEPASEADAIDEVDGNYSGQNRELEEEGYSNQAYGRVITDSSGNKWLEYWYWYYYDSLAVAGQGVHEGDWESVLISLNSEELTDDVVLSVHKHALSCSISEMELTERGTPIVYVGEGSHANYPKAGDWGTEVPVVGHDIANGEGEVVTPGLVDLEGELPSWIDWPGHWGATSSSGSVGEATSPPGPAFHEAWEDPAAYSLGAEECMSGFGEGESLPFETGIQSAAYSGNYPQVKFHVPGGTGEGSWPRLQLTVEEFGDEGLPPLSKVYYGVGENGEKRLPIRVKPGHKAEVSGSIFYKDGRRIELVPKMIGRSPRGHSRRLRIKGSPVAPR